MENISKMIPCDIQDQHNGEGPRVIVTVIPKPMHRDEHDARQ